MGPKKGAFTLIELLVVIAIIGILTTISVVAFQNARAKSRDAKRAADVKQIQTALELYYNDKGHYPTSAEFNTGSLFSTTTDGTTTYMSIIPVAPDQNDGDCTVEQNTFVYNVSQDRSSYTIGYCTGGTVGSMNPGPKCATPSGVSDIDCSAVAVAAATPSTCAVGDINQPCPSGFTTSDAGCYCGGGTLFYVDATSHRYYILARNSWYGTVEDPTAPFGCKGTLIGTSALIGTGQTNSNAILAACSTSGTAVQLADYYTVGDYSDWYLPSADELSTAASNLGFAQAYHYYQLSTESDANNNLYMRNDGYIGLTIDKSSGTYVRPIRSAIY